MEGRASKKTRQILMVKLERSTTDQNTSHPHQKGSGISWFPVDDQHFAIGCRKYAEWSFRAWRQKLIKHCEDLTDESGEQKDNRLIHCLKNKGVKWVNQLKKPDEEETAESWSKELKRYFSWIYQRSWLADRQSKLNLLILNKPLKRSKNLEIMDTPPKGEIKACVWGGKDAVPGWKGVL